MTARLAAAVLIGALLTYAQPAETRLIIQADDVGMARSVNRAAFAAVERGTVSSISVMVTGPAFDDAVELVRAHPGVDVGVELTLTCEWTGVRWGPVLPREEVSSLTDAAGNFRRTWDPARAKPAEVEKELRAQIQRARDAGLPISHLEVHQFVLYRSGSAYAKMLARISRDEDLPILLAKAGLPGSDEIAAALPGTQMLERLTTIGPGEPPGRWQRYYELYIQGVPAGVSELIVHPGYNDAELQLMTAGADAWDAAWRQRDFDLLMSDQFRQQLGDRNVLLVKWRGLRLPPAGTNK